GGDRITEIGIVRVDCASPDAPPRVTEWATLVDPQVTIPGVIQALTGIGDAMVSGAPTFSTIAPRVQAMLDGCIFAAHDARFDFGFLKHAFACLGHDFSPRTLCTLRLARRLDPDAQGHGLDALLRESELFKSRMPARNRTLRRKAEAGIMEVVDGVPRLELARDRA
ncbi:MAG: PolC-type DNA polymerase III, partial [Betaproteobacteria bacterium]